MVAESASILPGVIGTQQSETPPQKHTALTNNNQRAARRMGAEVSSPPQGGKPAPATSSPAARKARRTTQWNSVFAISPRLENRKPQVPYQKKKWIRVMMKATKPKGQPISDKGGGDPELVPKATFRGAGTHRYSTLKNRCSAGGVGIAKKPSSEWSFIYPVGRRWWAKNVAMGILFVII